MPADVETMFSARVMPWHQIGTVTDDVLTAQEALAAAELDWSVELRPVQVVLEDGTAVEVDNRFGVVRDSDSSVLGVVGSSYRPLQNRDAFTFFDNLVDSGDAKYETAGSLKDGRWVFMTAKMPNTMSVGGVDDVDTYLLLHTSHDGLHAVRAAVTPVRVVCTNTLNLAFGSATARWAVPHTTTIEARLAEARETLELTFKFQTDFQAEAEKLLATPMTERQFKTFATKLVKDTPQEGDVTVLSELFADAENLENVRGTAWAGFNAVAEYTDWFRGYRSTEAQVVALQDGWALKMKQRAAHLLTA